MRLSQRYSVPSRLALLYDFLNSVDRRRYVEQGMAHAGGDELETAKAFREWLVVHGLDAKQFKEFHQKAQRLRDALRALLKVPPESRRGSAEALAFDQIAGEFPLVVTSEAEGFGMRTVSGSLGSVVLQLLALSLVGDLDRLKVCASDECGWVFFDRSKPGNRRWCSSQRCGNREKTRAYRARLQASPA